MAEYRKLSFRFWTDPRVHSLDVYQKIILSYCITGIHPCKFTNVSGIYEMPRGSLCDAVRLDIKQVAEALEFFNQERPDLLEYDSENHMVFVKSFFKHNSKYRKDISGLMDDFENTFHKTPQFWAEFGEKNRSYICKHFKNITDENQINFLERLFNLKNEISEIPSKKPIIIDKKNLSLANESSLAK